MRVLMSGSPADLMTVYVPCRIRLMVLDVTPYRLLSADMLIDVVAYRSLTFIACCTVICDSAC